MDINVEDIRRVARIMDDLAIGERTPAEMGAFGMEFDTREKEALAAAAQPMWLVVGSGPSAKTMFQIAAACPFVQSITANSGLLLLPGPDYFMIYETMSIRKFATQVPELRKKYGTKLVACKIHGKSMRTQLTLLKPEYPIFVKKTNAGGASRVKYARGSYVAGSFTGSLMLQFALEHGAKTVLLVGLDGYRSKQGSIVADTFDGRKGTFRHDKMTQEIYGPMMRLVMRTWSEVQFIYFGRPHYEIAGDNVIVYDEDKFDVNAIGRELLHQPELQPVGAEAGGELRQTPPATADPPATGHGRVGSELRPEGSVPPRHDAVEAGTAPLD